MAIRERENEEDEEGEGEEEVEKARPRDTLASIDFDGMDGAHEYAVECVQGWKDQR